MKIKLLKILQVINYLASDLLCCTFIVIALWNIKVDEIKIRTVLYAILFVYPGIYLLHIFTLRYYKYIPISPSSVFIMLLCLYGLVQDRSRMKATIYLLYAMIVNLLMKEILRILIENIQLSERNKQTLYHEVGHYIINRLVQWCSFRKAN